MNKFIIGLGLVAGLAKLSPSAVPAQGDTVAVVFNSRMPESQKLAEYYARRRAVPADQVFGLDLPTVEAMTRAEFQGQLQKPLLKLLEDRKLFVFDATLQPATQEKPGQVIYKLSQSRIRYLALCHGVPVRILKDPNLMEEGTDNVRPELRRNEAAVDSELALLPQIHQRLPLAGPLKNGLYNTTNAAALHPTNGILLVARLDGPSVEIARGLVDKAMQAEADGLWGRAYFDVRGLTDGSYKVGDDWIRMAEQIARQVGFDSVLDTNAATFSTGFPMSQIALYAGWYDGNVSGPFTRSVVEFMPGAIAYHLHSYSAATIRSASMHWVGPLLAKGATATLGCVDEPYLEWTPDVAALFVRLFLGFSFGEAAYASQSVLSWQTTVVGDPLYRPFGKSAQALHYELLRRKSHLAAWSYLLIVNRNLDMKQPAAELIDYLIQQPLTKESAVLQEKLAVMYSAQDKLTNAVASYRQALQLDPTPQQRVRLMLELARAQNLGGQYQEAYATYLDFLKRFPDYPDLTGLYYKLLPLANKLGKKEDADRYLEEINRAVAKP